MELPVLLVPFFISTYLLQLWQRATSFALAGASEAAFFSIESYQE